MLTIAEIYEAAEELEAEYVAIAAQCRPAALHGVLHSEMLFALAAFRRLGLTRIVESGRMFGGSTEILAHFGAEGFYSYEIDRNAAAMEAEDALEGLDVALCYGDGRREVPPLAEPGVLVLIDGPKRREQQELALACLKNGATVLVHDAAPQKLSGRFLRHHGYPFIDSSDREFVRRFQHLDAPCWGLYAGKQGRELHAPYVWKGKPAPVYGPTLALLEPGGNVDLARRRM